MTIHYVTNSLRPATVPSKLDERIYLALKLWADEPPLSGVRITYKFPDGYTGPYSICQGASRTVTVSGTETQPEEIETWLMICGPSPPPATLKVFAVIEHKGVRRRGGVTLLMSP